MLNVRRIPLFALLAIVFFTGCAGRHPKLEELVVLERSNAYQIEESIRGLDIAGWLTDAVPSEASITLRSIENGMDLYARRYLTRGDTRIGKASHSTLIESGSVSRDNVDWGVRKMIEDNLLTEMSAADFSIVERDPDLLLSLFAECRSTYSFVDPLDLLIQTKYDVEEESADSTGEKERDTIKKAELGRELQDYLVSTPLRSADYILSYRVLECGVLYRSKGLSNYDRLARARLHCRLLDAKTGELLKIGVLDNEVVDEISRKEALKLRRVHYRYYDYKMPGVLPEDTANPLYLQGKTMPAATGAAERQNVNGGQVLGMTVVLGILVALLVGNGSD